MNRRRRLPLSAPLLFLLFAHPASAQVLPIPQEPDYGVQMQQYTAEGLRDYTAMLGEWRGAWRRGDARAVARFLTEDATLRLADGVEISGRRFIEGYLRENVVAGSTDLTMAVTDFAVGGSLGYAMGRYTLRADEARTNLDEAGVYVAVLRRSGRSWRIRALVFTAAPAAGSAATPQPAAGLADHDGP